MVNGAITKVALFFKPYKIVRFM